MKVMKIIEHIMTILLAVVVVIALGFVYMPQMLGYTPYAVVSGSMSQISEESDRQYYKENYGIDVLHTYDVGCMVYVSKVDFEDILPGDSITFSIGNTVVTHMVIEVDKENKTLTTHGIKNSLGSNENNISYSNVVGKATDFSIPFAGYVLTWASTMPAKILLITYIAIFAVVLIANHILEKLDEKEKGKDEEKTEGQSEER